MVKKKSKTSRKRVTIVPRQTVSKKKEMTLLGSALRSLGGLGGGALGGMIGMGPSGASVGSSLGAAISKWLGSGDYSVSSNSIISGAIKSTSSIPVMHNSGQAVTVRHKEYIGQLLSSTSFNVRYQLPINPGRFDTFPWLSAIAKNFQEYNMKGMVFHYIPSSGSAIASTNNALGTVMFQTSYRANETAPQSKHELLNEYWAGETVPSEVLCHPIECDPRENPFKIQYTRVGDVPAGDSKLLYDLGTTYIAVSGQQANNIVLGDVWVTYEVELRKPVLFSNVSSDAQTRSMVWTGGSHSAGDYFPANATTITSYGLLDAVGVAGSRNVQLAVGTVGEFSIAFVQFSTAGATNWTTSGASVLTNCSFVNDGIGFDADACTIQTTSTGTTILSYNVVVRKVDKDSVATIALPGWTATGGSINSSQLRVSVNSL